MTQRAPVPGRERFCLVKGGTPEQVVRHSCMCGWPRIACQQMYPAHENDPPEPGCYDDGETWRNF